MSQQKIIDTLQNLGFSSLDAQVYLFLGKKGPKKVSELVQSLKIPKQQLYAILKNLQSKGIINATLQHPAIFSTEPFEKVLDLFVKARMEEIQTIQGNKSQILADWQSIKLEEDKDKPSAFKVLEGKSYIYPKLRQIIEEAQTQLLVILTIPELIQINQNQVLDELLNRITKSPVKLRILTDISSSNIGIIHTLFKKKISNLEIRVPDLGLKLPNSMVIRDQNEIAFMIDSTEVGIGRRTCLWTNCEAIVQSFNFVFNNFWNNATDIYKKITEFKTGKPSPKTIVIKDSDTAKEKYAATIGAAKKSIFILTPSAEIVDYVQKVEGWVRNGISVRIMAPILNENLDSARQIMKLCEIKHVPEGYMGTTIVDSQNLFQIKIPISRKRSSRSMSYFEDTIYSNDAEFVKKTENMFNDIWNNAQIPSLTTLKEIIEEPSSLNKNVKADIFTEYRKEFKKIVGFQYKMEPQPNKVTEKEILDKIANAVRTPAEDPEKDTIKFYGTLGIAIIYPPKDLNLPAFMIHVNHYNNKSSFGAGSSLFIYIQTAIADQQSYLPAAFVTNNWQGFKFRKLMHARLHSNEIINLMKKDQLKVSLRGETLFAGWTVPIPLLPPKYILPPGCLTIEGYGNVKTYISEAKGPMNRRIAYEFTSKDAFVSFTYPSSKYNGPGSDAVLHTKIITTSRPPSTLKENEISAQ